MLALCKEWWVLTTAKTYFPCSQPIPSEVSMKCAKGIHTGDLGASIQLFSADKLQRKLGDYTDELWSTGRPTLTFLPLALLHLSTPHLQNHSPAFFFTCCGHCHLILLDISCEEALLLFSHTLWLDWWLLSLSWDSGHNIYSVIPRRGKWTKKGNILPATVVFYSPNYKEKLPFLSLDSLQYERIRSQ